jgi:hypothetical protein
MLTSQYRLKEYAVDLVLTCEGDARLVSLSCCSVLSTPVCCLNVCRAFEGPQSASAIFAEEERPKEK